MSQKLFLNTGRETIKGGALHALKDAGNFGAFDFATLVVTTAVVDAKEFKLGEDVYESNLILTDTGAESVAIVEVGDTSIIFDTPPTIAPVPGDVLRMETEFMIVIDYNVNGPSVNVVRGAFGSTEAEHSIANSDTFQAAQSVRSGNLAVPVSALANATSSAQVAAAVEFWNVGYSKGLGGGIGVRVQNGLKVDAVSPGAGTIVFAYPADGGVASTSDGLDSVTVNFTDGGAGEDFLESVDGTDFLELGIEVGEVITIAASVANDGAYTVLSVSASQINVATASWTDEAQADAITISQGDAFTNGVLSAFGGGVEPAGKVYSRLLFKATGTGAVSFFAPFVVDEAYVTIWGADGAIIEAAANTVAVAGGRLVTVSAAGSLAAGVSVEVVVTAA